MGLFLILGNFLLRFLRGESISERMLDRVFQRLKGVGVFLGLVLLIGCTENRLPDANEGVSRQILLVGNGPEPQTLDPQIAMGVPESHILAALLEGLIAFHPTNDELPEPGVAERWERSEDGKVWTFYLRKEARWSNGDPVTAHDFVYAYKRILTPALGSPSASDLYVIEGAAAYHRGESDDFTTVGVKAVEDRILELQLVAPTPHLLNILKSFNWYPLHRPTIERFGGIADRSGAWTQVGNFVGNGPFVLKEWKPDQYIEVVASDTYWDHEHVQLEGIVFYPIVDVNTEKRMFESGRLHVTEFVPINDVRVIRSEHPEWLHLEPWFGIYFYMINTTREALADQRVRRALSLAIDRDLLAEKVTQGIQMAATSFVPAMFDWVPKGNPVYHDPEEARGLLAAAGYPNGEGFPEFEIMFNTREDHRKIAEAIAQMWNRELNIQVRLINKDWKVYLENTDHLEYDIARRGWIGGYPSAQTFLEIFRSDNENNGTGWTSPLYDEYIAEAINAKTVEDQNDWLKQAEALLMAEMPVIPLYWYSRVYLLDPRVKGWYPKVLGNHPYKYLYLAEDKGRREAE